MMKETFKNILSFEFWQKFGKALMVVIAVMPAAGLMISIGKSLVMINPTFAPLVITGGILEQIGWGVIGNLHILFALAIGGSWAKERAGGAFAAGLAFILINRITGTIFGVSGAMLKDPQAMVTTLFGGSIKVADYFISVMEAPALNMGVFVGIISGFVGATAFNKYYNFRKLPDALSFFNGKRFVPFVVILRSAIAAIVLSVLWPLVQTGINNFGIWIANSQENAPILAPFLYGTLERLLLPFGLHHGLNWPVRTTELGGAWEIGGQRVVGTINAYLASLADPNVQHVDPSITRFNGGKFVYFMFGLSGAAYAMYKTADEKKRKVVGSLLFAAAGTSFLTGITEPIEFTFLFVAPILYVVHAFLAGSALFVMHMLGAGVATPTGHGFINWVIYGVLQGPKTAWWLVPIVGVVYFFIYYIVFRFMIVKFDLKTPGREDGDDVKLSNKNEARAKLGVEIATIGKEEAPKSVDVAAGDDEVMETVQKTPEGIRKQAIELVKAHGGPDNIEAVDACITRLRINVKDKNLVDQERITTKLGAMGFAESDMQMQSIYGSHANVLKMEIQEMLGMEE